MRVTLEEILTKYSKEEMLERLDTQPKKVGELIQLATSCDKKLSPRAAWLLSNYLKDNDPKFKPHIDKAIGILRTVSDGHARELIHSIDKMDLNEEQEGQLFDVCVDFWISISRQPSLRSVSFRFLIITTEKHPDLLGEILLLSQDQYIDSLSPGIRRSIQKMIKTLKAKQ